MSLRSRGGLFDLYFILISNIIPLENVRDVSGFVDSSKGLETNQRRMDHSNISYEQIWPAFVDQNSNGT